MTASIFSARHFSNKSEESFSKFLQTNRTFWGAYDSGDAGRHREVIFVDLMETYVTILHINLLIAKYVQRICGGRLVGVTSSSLFQPEDFQRVRAMAESFGISEVFDFDSEQEADADFRPQARDMARSLTEDDGEHPDPIDRLIAARDPQHPFLGSAIYAALVRWLRTDSIDLSEPSVQGAVEHMLVQCERLRRCFEGTPITAFVTAHTHYLMYSSVAVFTLRHGGHVYYQHPGKNIFILRFSDTDDLFHCRPHDFTEWFHGVLTRTLRSNADFLAFEQHFLERVHGSRHDIDAPLKSHPVNLGENSAAIVIYAHALVDNVHGWGRYIYRDFADWMNATLEIAATTPDVTFYVKPHPSDAHYDASGFMARMRRRYGAASNIVFLDRLHPGFRPGSVAAGVTVQGAPGLELAACGMRMICLSAGRFGDLGFAHVPQSVAEYRNWLTNPASIQSMSTAEVHNARALAFYESVAGRSRSWFSAGLRHEDSEDYFDRCREALLSHVIGEDPLLRDLVGMKQANRGFILNGAWARGTIPVRPVHA
jgi:hypothetical protein